VQTPHYVAAQPADFHLSGQKKELPCIDWKLLQLNDIISGKTDFYSLFNISVRAAIFNHLFKNRILCI